MKLTILGASGATGREITRQALERGHTVIAVARNPQNIPLPDSDRLIRVAADVRDPAAIAKALAGSSIVISGLGVSKDEKAGVLKAGAEAVVAAKPQRIIWMGALGSGTSGEAAGAFTRWLLATFMKEELVDKVAADTLVLKAGGTVFHAGTLNGKPVSATRHTVTLDKVPRHFFPSSVSRATVAAAMLDEVEKPQHTGVTVVPLDK